MVDGIADRPADRAYSHAQRPRERLEYRLALVMRVVAAQIVDVQGDQGVVGEALEELVREVDVEGADHRARERHVELEARPPGQVDHHARQRLVERNVGMAVTDDAFLVADGGLERLAKRDADVLDRVVRVDMEVALGADGEIDHAVARDLVQHVVEERHAGGEVGAAAAVEVDLDGDLGLGRLALDPGGAAGKLGGVHAAILHTGRQA